jgi:ComF family protein
MTTPLGIGVYALGPHQGALSDLVRRLKYKDETLIASRLGTALGRVVPSAWQQATFAPVPLHPERLASRGFNQSALLARAAGRVTGMRVATDLLRRKVNTDAQAKLRKSERQSNVHEAFCVLPRRVSFSSPTIVLVDDVVTTGSTMDACSLALRDAGVQILGIVSCTIGADETERPTAFPAKTL